MAIRRSTEAGKTTVIFILSDDHDGPVSVVGSFNDWQPGAHPLELDPNGARSVEVVLPEGADVHFRYLGSGGAWFDDPDADQITADGSILFSATSQASSAQAEYHEHQTEDPAPSAEASNTETRSASGTLKRL
jgi:hypothetical protein